MKIKKGYSKVETVELKVEKGDSKVEIDELKIKKGQFKVENKPFYMELRQGAANFEAIREENQTERKSYKRRKQRIIDW